MGRATFLSKRAPEFELGGARYEQSERDVSIASLPLAPAFKKLWCLGAFPDQCLEMRHTRRRRPASDTKASWGVPHCPFKRGRESFGHIIGLEAWSSCESYSEQSLRSRIQKCEIQLTTLPNNLDTDDGRNCPPTRIWKESQHKSLRIDAFAVETWMMRPVGRRRKLICSTWHNNQARMQAPNSWVLWKGCYQSGRTCET
jgi:hypothetical protein